ncbi:MAG: DUF1097 domain-containing protein, partial [Deltaproteobacteria bacterium]|nr:DUF1097 domain-containing protein [Deltaproteobacteria bacterium]
WASYYYAGGDTKALHKSYIANVAGMLQGAIFLVIFGAIGGGSMHVLAILIGIYCFIMTMEGAIGLLSTIPGQFLGAAVYFGNLSAGATVHKGDIWYAMAHTAVIMLIGNLFGIVSAKAPGWFQKPAA